MNIPNNVNKFGNEADVQLFEYINQSKNNKKNCVFEAFE